MSSAVHIIRARSEDIAEYRRSIACLSALMRQWEAVNRHYSEADPVKLEQIRQRYLEMQRYGANIRNYSADKFAQLTEQIPDMIEFVRQDIEQVQQAQIEQHVEQRQQQRAQQQSATMLRELLAQQMPEQQVLIQQLAELAEGKEYPNAGQLLNQAMLVISQQPKRLTEAQQALAQRLKEPESGVSPSSALPPHDNHHADRRLQRIDKHIAELAVLDPQRDMTSFLDRAAELEQQPQNTHWNMLSDSLTLDLAEATRTTRTLTEKRQQLDLLLAGLASYHSDEANALIEKLNIVLTSRELPLLLDAIAATQAATEQLQLSTAALARREAVLAGLAKLGYEVHESDAGTWLDAGKVVIRKPATPGYGLELAGAQGSERFQARAVAFSEQRNTQRDTDIESIWCSEHQKLQQILAEAGDTLTIERALAAGASPLKVAKPANAMEQPADYHYRGESSRSLD